MVPKFFAHTLGLGPIKLFYVQIWIFVFGHNIFILASSLGNAILYLLLKHSLLPTLWPSGDLEVRRSLLYLVFCSGMKFHDSYKQLKKLK